MKHETLNEERRRLAYEIRLQKKLMKARSSPRDIRAFMQSRVCNQARREARAAHLAHTFLLGKNSRKDVEGIRHELSEMQKLILRGMVMIKVYQKISEYPKAMAKFQNQEPTLETVRMLVNEWLLT